MRTSSIRTLLCALAMALLPALASAHPTVDIGVALHAPEAVATSSSFVVTTEVTDYAHDAAAGVVIQFKLSQGLQAPKSFNTPVWRCATISGLFSCGADSIPAGTTTLSFTLVAPATAGVIDIQAENDTETAANFDPFPPNNKAAAQIHVYSAAACTSQSVSLAAPGDGSGVNGGHVNLSWTPVAGASRYRIWTAVEGADASILGETSATAFAADVPVGSTEWWVDALFDLCPTASSSHSHFISNGSPLQWSVDDLAGQAGVRGDHDATGTNATFETPSSLGIDIYGEIVVVDSEASTLRVIAPNGTVVTLAGQAGQTGARDSTQSFSLMNHPEAIAVAPGGFGYVADTGNSLVRQFFPTGDGIATFTPFLGSVAGSAGIAASTDGTGTAARFNLPAGIAILPDFTVFVSDTGANRIRKISPTGVTSSLTTSSVAGFSDGNAADARFNGPTGVAIDRSGNVFIADTGNNVIRRLGTNGNVTTIAGTAGVVGFADGRGTAATLNHPTALAFDALGNLFVADSGNNAIRQVAPSGLVTTMIGTGSAGHENGSGRTAMLSAPTGLAVDAAGRLVIADGGNRVVRVATPAAQPSAPAEPKPRRRAAQH